MREIVGKVGVSGMRYIDIYYLLERIDNGYVPNSVERRTLDELQCLVLCNTNIHNLPNSIGRLKNLQELNLRKTYITELPESICNLKNLKNLYLSGSQIKKLPDNIGQMQGLHTLNLGYTNIAELPISIGDLKNLKCLHLGGSNINELPGSIGKLKELQVLSLINTSITDLPESIKELINLKEVHFSNTKITKLPDGICNLINLRKLNLTNCKIYKLPKNIGDLKNLTELDLRYTPIIELPESIGELENLQRLQLSHSRISKLPDNIRKLKKLRQLYLTRSNITELPNCINELENLETLTLFGTKIKELPNSIGELPKLRILNIGNLTLNRIPKSLAFLGLPFDDSRERLKTGINVYGLILTDQPLSIFTEAPELIPTLYADEESEVTVRESKVIFLGDGGTGKSYTIKRFMHGGRRETAEEPYLTSETPGIEIIDCPVERGEDSFNIHFWDFGGQEILHSMHRCFLTEQTCYVVMVQTRQEKPNQRARYWLRNISVFAPKSPILLMVNCWEDDNGLRGIDEKQLRQVYPNIRAVVRCSAKYGSDEAFRLLMDEVEKMAAESGGCTQRVPKSWNDVRLAIKRENTHYLTKRRYHELCEESGISDANAEPLLTFFNNLGVCFSYHKGRELTEYKLLNPLWLTKAIYAIIREGMDSAQQGKINIADINNILGNPPRSRVAEREYTRPTYTPEECGYIIDVAEAHNLCYRIDDSRLFFPALCRNETPVEKLPTEDEYPRHMAYRLKYAYLPDSVIHQLMIMCYKNDININECWLEGLIAGAAPGHKVLIRMGDDDTTLNIDIYSKDDQPAYALFGLLRQEIMRINGGLNLSARDFIVDGEDEHTVVSLLSALNKSVPVIGPISGNEKDAGALLGLFYDSWTVSRMKAVNGIILFPLRMREYHRRSKSDKTLRYALWKVYDGICQACHNPIDNQGEMEVDHIFPKNYDKSDKQAAKYAELLEAQGMEAGCFDYIENYLPVHKGCNIRKSNRFDLVLTRTLHDTALKNSEKVVEKMKERREALNPTDE